VVNQDLGARLEVLLVSSSPPVVLVSGLVKLAALIVKAMTQSVEIYEVGCRKEDTDEDDTPAP
jgi:hypothetical protein